jgi:hypothetical protein
LKLLSFKHSISDWLLLPVADVPAAIVSAVVSAAVAPAPLAPAAGDDHGLVGAFPLFQWVWPDPWERDLNSGYDIGFFVDFE